MVTGVECAGLILAVLPLVIEGVKIYLKGVDDMKEMALTSRRDEKLEDFYETFLDEVARLEELILRIVGSLSSLSDDQRQKLVAEIYLKDWRPDADANAAFLEFLGPSMGQFNRSIRRIVKILYEIIDEPGNLVTAADMDEAKMCAKLEAFVQKRKDKTSTSSLKERFRFWSQKEKRLAKVTKLEKQNGKLERILQRCTAPQASSITVSDVPKSWQASIDKIQALGRILYGALTQCWRCSCSSQHEARFCLKSIDHSVVVADVVEGNFDFLIHTATAAGQQRWQEGNILVRKTSSTPTQQHEALLEMCKAANSIPGGMSLQVLVEDLQGTPKSWKLRPQPRRLKLTHTKPSITLQELLKASLVEAAEFKKELALTIALSLLGLEESTWLRQGWSKQSISFFHTADDKLDIARPFLATTFEHCTTTTTTAAPPSADTGHRNARILELGILLIEIELGRPLESFRAEIDRASGNANPYTDFGVAALVAEKKLIGSSLDYREAVDACLRTPWVPGDQEVSLSDARVRLGVYADVVMKLKNEVSYVLRKEF